jgi:hypothetical protein
VCRRPAASFVTFYILGKRENSNVTTTASKNNSRI